MTDELKNLLSGLDNPQVFEAARAVATFKDEMKRLAFEYVIDPTQLDALKRAIVTEYERREDFDPGEYDNLAAAVIFAAIDSLLCKAISVARAKGDTFGKDLLDVIASDVAQYLDGWGIVDIIQEALRTQTMQAA